MIFSQRPANYRDFRLSDTFLDSYRHKQPNWGFGDLSYIVYKRTYARKLPNGTTEEFWQTCRRVTEGTYNIQKLHCSIWNLPWSNDKAQRSAQTFFKLMWNFKFLPPGRGLAHMGTTHILERTAAYLLNCGFVSTKDIKTDYSAPFTWCMDMSMLGVGVGFDTLGAGTTIIQEPKRGGPTFIVEDTRESWVDAFKAVLDPYVGKGVLPSNFDLSKVRKKGATLKTIGGAASGPEPLQEMLDSIIKLYDSYINKTVDSTLIVDTFNISGRCVVSGGVRRTAQIALGHPTDYEFQDLKLDKEKTEGPDAYRWASNNSIKASLGLDYSRPASRSAINGEPGYAWLENMRAYSRMIDPPDYIDNRVVGGNPCLEQSLEDRECCCLVETFPAHHETLDEWILTLKYAYLYAKTVTLLPIHDQRTNAVQMRNRRIGLSQSGVVQAIKKFGRYNYFQACDKGYHAVTEWDKTYSEWLVIPDSIKKTSIKPSGTVSLLAGATPGKHYPICKHFYIRRIQFDSDSTYLKPLREAGYNVIEHPEYPNTFLAEFPVKSTLVDRSEADVSMWEQVKDAVDLQKYWADNQVSCTVKFKPEEANDIKYLLECFETELKGISFLPLKDHGYDLPPYEEITETQYQKMISKITPLPLLNNVEHEAEDKFCDGEACLLSLDIPEEIKGQTLIHNEDVYLSDKLSAD